MKELFREREIEKVSFYAQLLEEAGIPAFIRNESLMMSGLTDFPIPDFFPALCVVEDADYPRAVELIRAHLDAQQEASDREVPCPACGETNPGNFGECWNCGAALVATDTGAS